MAIVCYAFGYMSPQYGILRACFNAFGSNPPQYGEFLSIFHAFGNIPLQYGVFCFAFGSIPAQNRCREMRVNGPARRARNWRR